MEPKGGYVTEWENVSRSNFLRSPPVTRIWAEPRTKLIGVSFTLDFPQITPRYAVCSTLYGVSLKLLGFQLCTEYYSCWGGWFAAVLQSKPRPDRASRAQRGPDRASRAQHITNETSTCSPTAAWWRQGSGRTSAATHSIVPRVGIYSNSRLSTCTRASRLHGPISAQSSA